MMRLLATAVAAAAPGAPLATVPADVPIAAHGVWVAWSVPVDGGYRLVAARDGRVVTPPVALSAKPFDLDLGTDERGRAVATFTRCATRCTIRVLDLARGSERKASIRGTGAFPSMWRGRIAFARRAPGAKSVDRVMLWSRGESLRTLRHGPVDRCSRRERCDVSVFGRVRGLDLGERFVAFRWDTVGPNVIGHRATQIRADRLSDGRAFVLGSGVLGEVCTEGTDTVDPGSPSVVGDEIWFARRTASCYRFKSWVLRTRAGRGGGLGRFEGDLLRFVKTASAAYGLVTTRPSGEDLADCEPAHPCEIRALALPRLNRRAPRPTSPFF